MKNQKGITLIALIVTIIVLLILAAVSIIMFTGNDSGITTTKEARYENIINEFDDNVKYAQITLQKHITSNKTSQNGYIATAGIQGKYEKNSGEGDSATNFGKLTKKIADLLNATLNTSSNQELNREGYTVESYLDTVGTDTNKGTGYIVIWYTSNTLRNSLPNKFIDGTAIDGTFTEPIAAAESKYLGQVTVTKAMLKNESHTSYSVNEASLCYIIKVENYDCKLSNMILTDNTTATEDLKQKSFAGATTIGKTYEKESKKYFTYVENLNLD